MTALLWAGGGLPGGAALEQRQAALERSQAALELRQAAGAAWDRMVLQRAPRHDRLRSAG